MFQSSRAHSQLYRSYRMSPTLYQTDLRITNHRGRKFPPSLPVVSFKTRIEWPPVLTATASFPSVFFQLLQYSTQHPSFSAHKAAIMTKTDLTFLAFSSRFVDFAVQFCFHCKFSFHEKRFVYDNYKILARSLATFHRQQADRHKFIIYATRQRARADNLTICYRKNQIESSLTVAWFSWTNHNSLLRIATNEISSFCIDNRLGQMAFLRGKGRLSN